MRLIDSDVMLEELKDKEVVIAQQNIADWIDEQPTVDAEPTRYGKWNTPYDAFHDMITIVCSLCGHTGAKHLNYCPNCGAKMDGE